MSTSCWVWAGSLPSSPNAIFSYGGEQAPIVKKATATIPIVVVVSTDPVESGIVASLGRPGKSLKQNLARLHVGLAAEERLVKRLHDVGAPLGAAVFARISLDAKLDLFIHGRFRAR
mgnify:CR=1 FL=1